ncbi:hypothetical protein BofuT4_uP062030.1 [Botrytis cinerea T4]|uniref:Uncharacterized protein n=1 Tax=Botryotinia fuckeliana (strain T4) TaxID=999810 RepID=G2XU23_BOTF4|nr:hypothetical protein BofuT4_uP062030.1 [Botrytis cinerea T4]
MNMKRNGLDFELAGSTVGLHNSRCGNKDNSSSQLPLGAFRPEFSWPTKRALIYILLISTIPTSAFTESRALPTTIH